MITANQLILLVVFLLVAFPVHEFAHAWVADRLGDGTPRLFGRLTLNPAAHFDPLGGLMLVISVLAGGFIFGWAKPTPVNPRNLHDPRNGEVLVALAGPLSNLLMAAAAAVVVRAVAAADLPLPALLVQLLLGFTYYNVALAVFNLITIPPLDGATLLFRFLDPRTLGQVRATLSQYGFVILLAFVFLLGPRLSRFIVDATRFLVGF